MTTNTPTGESHPQMTAAAPLSGGFTLLEIVVVVLIIGILALIAMPHALQAHRESLGRACQQQRALLDAAIEQWALDHDVDDGTAVNYALLADYYDHRPQCALDDRDYTLHGVGHACTCDNHAQ